MPNHTYHINYFIGYKRRLKNNTYTHYKKSILMLCIIYLIFSIKGYCRDDAPDIVTINLHIQKVGNIEIPIIIREEKAFFQIKDIFDFLKIKNAISDDGMEITGFFINPLNNYKIDKKTNLITYKGRMVNVASTDLLSFESTLYINPQYLGEIFG